MSNDEEVLKELKKISEIMMLSNGSILESEISKCATTTDRKKIWVVIDGNRQADEIVKASGVTQAPVYKFLKILENVNLIERQRGLPPKRLFDYVPAAWVDLVPENSQQSSPEQKMNLEYKTQSGEKNG